ncbi:TPA: hypothetical protein QDB46_000187 [Burkholderia multivorans]|uniref:hypothetical protein n=1 Tax=Burkholderia multivorans TaxID=87883 RepID=UPI0015E48531|nr:hypothetical protein [Burkholderia multivorans]MDR8750787.1 hypothetical protein [Burkholderia multivorans]MDR8809655.1 hypothetical protein [Burkholderia multivorans]HDR9285133.1 hypothetical protein [Burkholderia multivorans]HDR9292502.1 hypothetical protein [Burkholderia multivorans]HDR9296517.1 hypothetical protein [Burkholderia multivorans]
MKLIDITGQRFGRLVVLGKGPKRPSKLGGSNWICRCDCGNEVIAVGSSLRSGGRKSCGCLGKEWAPKLGSNPEFIAKRASKQMKHGHKRKNAATAEYKTWLGMKRRCYDIKFKDYPNWGGRGIKVCDRWNDSFDAFFADMGPRPSSGHTIDRLDSNKDYEPGNCRWATVQEQGGENRRGLISVEIDGTKFSSLKSACEAYGMPYTAVFDRIKRGIDIETAMKTPIRKLPNNRTRESYLRKDSR